jgi:hypothetical protein
MDLSVLANLGEFVAGIGVIISLIYLAVQVRQNTAQVRASTTQAYSDAVGDLLESVYASPELTEFFVRALTNPDSMDEAEWIRWHMIMTRTTRHFDSAFYQFRTGTMDAEIWDGIRSSMLAWFAQPGIIAWFHRYGERVSPTLRAELEKALPALAGDTI